MKRDWLVRFAPWLVLGVPFLFLLVDRYSSVTTVFGSTRGLLVMAVVGIVWIGLSLLVLPRLVRNPWIEAGVMSAIALVMVWFVVVAAYDDKTVVETFPTAVAGAAPTSTVPGSTVAPPRRSTTTVPVEPVVLASGMFAGIDHDATGTVRIYRQPNGSRVVGLEDIDIEPGPDYFVWIVAGADQDSPGDGANLGKLRGNKGTQYYDVPADAPAEGPVTVLVWCRTFAVPVANSTPV